MNKSKLTYLRAILLGEGNSFIDYKTGKKKYSNSLTNISEPRDYDDAPNNLDSKDFIDKVSQSDFSNGF